MLVGCFAVGYFSAGTTATSPNGNSFQYQKNYSQNSFQFSTHNLTLHNKFLVSNLQHYPYASITNKTPYDTVPGKDIHYSIHLCSDDQYNVAAQQTWKASSRGACLISRIEAELFPVDSAHDYMTCAPYTSTPGTSYGTFFIIMDGDDACCVLSSHQKPQQCSSDTKSHSRIHMLA